MLLYKLKALECLLKENDQDSPKLDAVTKLQRLLLQIDHRVEVIPEYAVDLLIPILEEIQGTILTKDEAKLLREVIREIG